MSQALASALSQTIQAIQEEPEKAQAVFRAQTEWIDNVACKARIRQFELATDEPPSLGGHDSAPNPVELVLAALGTCQEVIYSAYAAFMGIPLQAVKVDVRGSLDLKGMFGLDESVPSGFQEITFDTFIQTSADAAEVQKLVDTVQAHCPVLDTLTRAIQVKQGAVTITKQQQQEVPSQA